MQVSVETKEGLTRVLNITVEANKFNDLFNQRLMKVAKEVKIDGFRPGKVPLTVVQQRYGMSISQEVAGEMMMQTFSDAAMQSKIVPAGMPSFKVNKLLLGQDFEYTATVEVFPEIELKSLQGETVEQITSTLTDEDFDLVVNKLREERAVYAEVDRAVQDQDEVTLDFDGAIDGKPLDQGKATDFKLVVGSKTMIAGFEEGLLGKKAGDTFDMKLQFPTEYHHKDIAGKDVVFKIVVHSVSAQQLPELNEAFFEELGIEEKTMAAFKAQIEKNMQRDLHQRLKSQNKKAIFDLLLKVNPIDVPKPLVEEEIDHMMEEAKKPFAHMQGSKKLDLPRDLFREESERRVQLGLLVHEVVKQHNLKVDDDRLQKEINQMSEAYADAEEYKRWINQNDNVRKNFEALVLEDIVADFLAGQLTVKTAAKKYQEILNPEDKA